MCVCVCVCVCAVSMYSVTVIGKVNEIGSGVQIPSEAVWLYLPLSLRNVIMH